MYYGLHFCITGGAKPPQEAHQMPTQPPTNHYTVKGPYAKPGNSHGTIESADRAAVRLDNRYGAYRHTVVAVPSRSAQGGLT